MLKLKSINPSNKQPLGEVDVSTVREIRQKVDKTHEAKDSWKELGVNGRVKILRKVVEKFKSKKEELAKMASSEMGMPISLSRADVDDALNYFNWYLDNAEKYLSPEIAYENEKIRHTVYREPIGVAANITPWNFPASNFVWSVGQSLISANLIVFKDSEEVPFCGKLLEDIMKKSGLPEGVFSEVYGGGDVGKILVYGNIDMICFTGST